MMPQNEPLIALNSPLLQQILPLLTQAFDRLSHMPERYVDKIVRIEVETPVTDLIGFWAAQSHPLTFFWSDRSGERQIAGIGELESLADRADLFEIISSRLSEDSGAACYFGGMRFSEASEISSEWSLFGRSCFRMPIVEWCREGDTYRFAVHVLWDGKTPPKNLLATTVSFLSALQFDVVKVSPHIPSLLQCEDRPSRSEWRRQVKAVLEKIEAGEGHKLVLARRTTCQFSDSFPASVLLSHLDSLNDPCYLFAFKTNHNQTFIGYSPELLFDRNTSVIRTEALAGTRPRGETTDEDNALAADLMQSAKDRSEHRLVLDHIQSALDFLCTSVNQDPDVSVCKLNQVQHLVFHLNGELASGITNNTILKRLHPTPAVGASPRSFLSVLSGLETFDRGWFSGPIGRISRESCQFIVGIRSCLAIDDQVHVYAGAGILAGSNAEKEWQELTYKMGPYLSLFNFL